MLIILYLFKCLDIKKLYFWVQIGLQILTCIPDPKKSNIEKKKTFFILIPHQLLFKKIPWCYLSKNEVNLIIGWS